ncbi:MAG: DUF427 domain-containing protein [Deltaproteobacteria bacterium]|nr:DUF427 domain-containing protein [Deltaproteobacteria bacterium]MBW2448484.1 DUF427 domain-containing protein [Deltaproteobacteria bacterium]
MNEDPKRYWRNLVRGRPAEIVPPGPGQESVWDYPRPPRVEASRRPVRIELAGEVLAASERALRVCETSSPPVYYVPIADTCSEWLSPSARRSGCEWKGVAHYWNVCVGDRRVADVAWSYPQPDTGFDSLRGHLAFYPGRVDACYLGDERVRPQAGDFYGGWVTAEIVGPFKGEPGTEGW